MVSNLGNPKIIYLEPKFPTGNSEIKEDLLLKKSKYRVDQISLTDNHIVLYIGIVFPQKFVYLQTLTFCYH